MTERLEYEVVPTTIDHTMPNGIYCPIHGDHSPAAYIGHERYGCWHCNPTLTVRRHAIPTATTEPVEIGEIPQWMIEA